MDDTTIPTWGYKPDGSAEIFDLVPGAALPDGWDASPTVIVDPEFATAEALTARAAGREYVPPRETAALTGSVDPDALGDALAEIDRLKGIIETGVAENERLIGEIEAAEAAVEQATASLAALGADLTKAQADGGFAVEERDAALKDLDAVKAELAGVRADLDALTAPPAAAKAGKAR